MKKQTTIRSQIMHGFTTTIAITLFLVMVSTVCLCAINENYKNLRRCRGNQISTQEAITAHYKWLDMLNESLQTGEEFQGSLDYNTCALGKWMAGIEDVDLQDSQIRSSLDAAISPHETIHSTASALLIQSKTDKTGAYLQYTTHIKPLTDQVISDLGIINSRYKEMADTSAALLQRLILVSLLAGLGLSAVAVFSALTYANRIAERISRPISLVADWSHDLAQGKENLNMADASAKKESAEITRMMTAFSKMAQSIRENVSIVKRVADGDMTAYVNIRSAEDSLGKNLYRMVQSNDLLFAEILEVAHSVAIGADEISHASQTLSQSVNSQAAAVTGLSETVDMAHKTVVETVEHTARATEISRRIQSNAQESREKMAMMVESVHEIQVASNSISAVIKSIDDIAFQTNILALNAAVEAARAGSAGLGFAVVASEVRMLALKSAEAAERSKALIESSIRKSTEGSSHSENTAKALEQMLAEVSSISSLIANIDIASEQQLVGIGIVREEIGKISEAATKNAAISEESAAASEQMNANADTLHSYMSRFNLRKRQEGQAYIPPEKRNDPEFIRLANENYRRARSTGSYGNAVVSAEDGLYPLEDLRSSRPQGDKVPVGAGKYD